MELGTNFLELCKDKAVQSLFPSKTEPENQVLETIEESNPPEQKEEPELTELDTEIQCPRCNQIMEFHSKL